MFDRDIFDAFNEFRRSMDRVWANWPPAESWARRGTGAPAGYPVLESGWTDEYVSLRFIVPGVAANDLSLTVQGDQLILQGERRLPEGFGKEELRHLWLDYGKFERKVDLPRGLDFEKLEAHLHDGVLDVRIPVEAQWRPKSIPIQAGTAESGAKRIAAA
jgi:HSP20 family protein